MGGGMDSVWPPSLNEFHFLAVSLLRCQKITIHLSLSPSLPCRLQTRWVLNIDGPHREARAVGASVTPGDVEHRHDTWDVLEGALCFFKQQNYFFPPFFIIRCWCLSSSASSRCAFDHHVYFCFLLLPWKRESTAKAVLLHLSSRVQGFVPHFSRNSDGEELWMTYKWVLICPLVLIDPLWFGIDLLKSNISLYLRGWRGWASETLTPFRISILVTACQSIIDFLLAPPFYWLVCLCNWHACPCILQKCTVQRHVFLSSEVRQMPHLYIQGDV